MVEPSIDYAWSVINVIWNDDFAKNKIELIWKVLKLIKKRYGIEDLL